MKKKWLKDLAIWFKLLFITKQQEIIEQKKEIISTGNDILDGTKIMDALNGGIHKEQKKFSRENNLVQEFSGEAPIVYESDMVTIKKQSQYGYKGDDATIDYDNVIADDIDFLTDKDIPDPRIITSTNKIAYFNSKEEFEARWEDIKRQARQDKPETELDGETELIDGIIKE